MSIKILGGFARGHGLKVPNGALIRPTSVMLRRRVYDFYQELDDVVFVDLCAGTGAMAFEAWSRGAGFVYLNEFNKHVTRILEDNIESLIVKHSHKKCGEIKSTQMSADKFIELFKTQYQKFTEQQQEETIIFLDPPYSEISIYEKCIATIKEGWFKGQLWIESDHLKGLSIDQVSKMGLNAFKIYEQGDSFIFVTNFPQE